MKSPLHPALGAPALPVEDRVQLTGLVQMQQAALSDRLVLVKVAE